MYHLLYTFYKYKSFHLFILSILVFIVLNIIENYIHYNIGRHRKSEIFVLSFPSRQDWFRIISIMLIFAFLQGMLTYILNRYI